MTQLSQNPISLTVERSLFDRVIEYFPSALIILDCNQTVQFTSLKFTEITGYTTADLIEQGSNTSAFIILPDDIKQTLSSLPISQQMWQGQFINTKKDGNKFTENLSVHLHRNENGQIIWYFLQFEETPECHQDCYKNILFKRLMEDSQDIIYLKDRYGNFLLINQAYTKYLQITNPSDAIGKNDSNYFPISYAQEIKKEEQIIIQTQIPLKNKLQEIRMPNNKTYWFLVSKYPIFNENHEVIGLIAIKKNVSTFKSFQPVFLDEKKDLINAHTLASIEDSLEGVTIADENNQITQVNTNLIKLLQIPKEIIIGQDIICFAQNHLNIDLRVLLHRFANDASSEKKIIISKTEIQDYKITLNPIYHNQEYHGLVLSVDDITEIAEARERAETANQIKTDFLKRISFEIRTPLDGLMGMLDLALEKNKEEELGLYLGIAKECGGSIVSLINELMDVTKIESGNFEIEESECQIDTLIKEAISNIKNLNDLQISYTIDPNIPDQFSGLIVPATQSLSILFEKARNLMKTSNIHLNVSLNELGSDSMRISFRVYQQSVDPEKFPNRIKEHDDPEIDAQTPIFCYFIKLLNGNYWIERDEKQILQLCLESSFTPISHPNLTEQTHLHGKIKVLLADDSRISGMVAKEILSKFNCDVTIVRNGIEAIEILRSTKFDLILMDVEMPEMDGLETTVHIRKMPEFQSIPILAMTAHTMQIDKKKYLQIGMNDLIPKPLDKEIIRRKLSQWAP